MIRNLEKKYDLSYNGRGSLDISERMECLSGLYTKLKIGKYYQPEDLLRIGNNN